MLFEYSNSDVLFIAIQIGQVVVCFLATLGFIILNTKLGNLQNSVDSLMHHSLSKYKYMFDTLEEAIMMITEKEISFFNKPSLDMFKKIQGSSSNS